MGAARAGRPQGALALADAPDTELAGTSHVSIVDAEGNAVGMTTTIETQFGSGGFRHDVSRVLMSLAYSDGASLRVSLASAATSSSMSWRHIAAA